MEPAKNEVIASLEGMKIAVDGNHCSLQEFSFDLNCWRTIETSAHPMSRAHAEEWLEGWNSVDRWTALNLLICSA
ncbi:MAG: hypothetical protein ACE141_17800 [Bryobacteraceae bacterium]